MIEGNVYSKMLTWGLLNYYTKDLSMDIKPKISIIDVIKKATISFILSEHGIVFGGYVSKDWGDHNVEY